MIDLTSYKKGVQIQAQVFLSYHVLCNIFRKLVVTLIWIDCRVKLKVHPVYILLRINLSDFFY